MDNYTYLYSKLKDKILRTFATLTDTRATKQSFLLDISVKNNTDANQYTSYRQYCELWFFC